MFLHHEPENIKQLSSGVVFADIGADDATGTVEGVTDGGQTGGQTTLTGQVTDQAIMQAEKTPHQISDIYIFSPATFKI